MEGKSVVTLSMLLSFLEIYILTEEIQNNHANKCIRKIIWGCKKQVWWRGQEKDILVWMVVEELSEEALKIKEWMVAIIK